MAPQNNQHLKQGHKIMNLWLSQNGQLYDEQGQSLTYWTIDDDDFVLSPTNCVGVTIEYIDDNGNEGGATILHIKSYEGFDNSISGAPFKYASAYLLEIEE